MALQPLDAYTPYYPLSLGHTPAGSDAAAAATSHTTRIPLRAVSCAWQPGMGYIGATKRCTAHAGVGIYASLGVDYTLQNFLPGFAALARGEVVITQEMVGQANAVFDRLVAAGSPALRQTISQERASYNNLQSFVGLTFAAATTLVEDTPAPRQSGAIYLPLVRK